MIQSRFAMAALIVLVGVIETSGQTNFYEQVSSQWYSGNKTGVLSIAEQRLQQNTNDIAGLILKMDYQIEFVELDTVSNTMKRVLDVGSQITTTNFAAAFSLVQSDINHLLQMLPLYPTNEIAADIAKASIANKPLTSGYAIKALQDDGYFQ